MNQKFIDLLEELDEGVAGAIGKHYEADEKKRDEVESACTCGGKWGKTNVRSLKKCNHYDHCGAIKKGLVEENIDEEHIPYSKYGLKKDKKQANGFYLYDKKTGAQGYGPFKTKELATEKLNKLDDNEKYYVKEIKRDKYFEEDLDEGRGRPKKDRSNEEPKIAGKRGRPKKDDINDPDDDESKAGKRDLTLYATISGGKGKNKQEAEETKSIKDANADDIDKMVNDYENVLTVKYANKWDFDEDEIKVYIKDNLGWTGSRAEDQTKDDEGSDAEDDSYSFGRMEK